MDEYCGSVFWDSAKTWYTPDPYFTPCFEQTVLVWIPCAFLWLFTGLEMYWAINSNAKNIPWSALNISKSLLNLALIILEFIIVYPILFQDNQHAIYPMDIYSPIIKGVTYILALFLLLFTKVKGVRSSGILFIFWFLSVVCEGIRFRTVLTAAVSPDKPERPPLLISYVVSVFYFPVIVNLFILNIWADVAPKYEKNFHYVDKPCPEKSASYASRLLYHWYTGMAWQGYRKPLDFNDLWELNDEDKSTTIVPKFNKYWEQELNKAGQRAASNPVKSAEYTKVQGTSVEFKQNSKLTTEKQYVSILPVLIKSFGATFFFGSALKLIPDLMIFVSPQILDLLIAFVNDPDDYEWKGFLYAFVLFASAFIQTLLMAQYSHRMYMTGMRVRTSLVSAVYRKALVVSNSAKRESTVGEIVNLMSVDVQKIMDLIPFVNMLWSSPLQIAVAMYFLWGILGPSVLAGLVVIILLVPANAIIAAKARKYQIIQMKHKDNRVKLMGEILSGIKVLKLYAWEPSFQSQISGIRDKEVEVLKQAAYLNAGTNFLWTCAPFLVSLATFGTYVLIDDTHVLDAQKAFVSLSLLNVINVSVTFLPMIIVFSVQAVVSLKRINKFMNSDEIDPEAVTHDASESDPIVIKHGSFAWEEQTVVLRDINLRVKHGGLVAIVGTVGSGKSSLLQAMLGELEKLNGTVNTVGSVAYVAQQAWIQNATLRDNILFGQNYERNKYKRVIDTCALKPDLDMLQAGDKTEIGEKGINLSGGQKQRVSLARAAYNESDIYLFDDPLSAVDAHVGKHIFDKVLGPDGILKKKTRVLVTHGVAFLPQVDQIIVMKEGEISETGSYKQLLAQKGAFAEFLSQHVTVDDISELDDSAIILQDLATVGVSLEEIIARCRKRGVAGAVDRNSDSECDALQTSTEAAKAYRRQMSTVSNRERRNSTASMASTILQDDNKLIEIEKSETESVKLKVYIDYFKAAGWGLTFWTAFFYLAYQGLSVGANLWLSEWSNLPVVNGTQDSTETTKYLGVYGAIGSLQAVAIMVATIIMALGTLKSAAVLHFRMLKHILRSPMSFFDTTPVGRIVNRFAKDVDVCDNTLPFMLRLWLNSFLQVVSTLLIICYTTPIFIALVFPIGLLYYFVQRFYVATSRQLKRLESVTRSPMYSHFGETISGSSTIRAYKQQERFMQESEAKVDYNQKSYFPAITSNRWLAVRLETVGNTVIFFAAVFAVLSRDTLNPGLVGLSVSYALQITIALNMLVRWTSDVETNIVAVERVKEYTDGIQEAAWEVDNRKPSKDWPEAGKVEFDHYQSRYREGLDLVLRDVTCTINPGEKIGIVGRTGAGKSSLTLGLFRIVEAAGGSIKIDGHDISKLGLHDVRGRITIIPQDPVLFSGTLRINLDPFGTHSDERIWNALELSHLKSFVKGLTSGLDYEITEGGENLSVGQRQLVCLARALLRKTKILVLDEATAAVDLETDDLIQNTIRTEFKDSTVITIAHRLNTIMDSTRVIVLDKGEIREFDSPANLLADKNSIFYSMAQDAGL